MGIETSCDDTSVAILEDNAKLRANLVSSQVDIHRKYGGIVPEIASRKHIENINILLEEARSIAGVEWKDIDLVSVTIGPGLIGSLLVGVSSAKAISLAMDIPLIGINHLKGHIYASFLEYPQIQFPLIALVVSGGHTNIILLKDHFSIENLGRTLDDATGEVFDKVARLLGLGYPGGALIDKKSQRGNPSAIDFPRAMLTSDSLDFSFSGLKTAVINYVRRNPPQREEDIYDLAASFQQAIIDVLREKIIIAVEKTGIRRVVLAGGVACNSKLRQEFGALEGRRGIKVYIPSPMLCTDNAAMIACAGYYQYQGGKRDNLDIDIFAQWNPVV